ncbi:MAG: chemotaxis protein CheW [Bacillota bacterium]|nr:chemotaxis protein CheW [Bacillota bacterium]
MSIDEMDTVQEEDTLKGKFLIFTIDKEDYGIEIKNVLEIVGMQPITTVPQLPEYIKGMINLRGKIIPVMDIRLRFKKEEIDYDDRTCIIIVQIDEIYVGLIVDRVSEVMNISEDEFAEVPELGSNSNNRYISSIGNTTAGVKIILDCNKIISDDEIDALSNLA